MNQRVPPTDLELAALISSRICHDIINPVGAIFNGLEILDEGDDMQAKDYALTVIRNVTKQASAWLEFARFAFGAVGSADSMIDLTTAEKISLGFVGTTKKKHKLTWRGASGLVAKDKVKLLLNLIASAITALPRGGEIDASIGGSFEQPMFLIRCKGTGARPPKYLTDFVAGKPLALDAVTIQAYYTWRIAPSAGMQLEILKDATDILLVAKPAP